MNLKVSDSWQLFSVPVIGHEAMVARALTPGSKELLKKPRESDICANHVRECREHPGSSRNRAASSHVLGMHDPAHLILASLTFPRYPQANLLSTMEISMRLSNNLK